QQGQTIGYVGMTGLATGPHLHYEYQVNGVHRDPQSAVLASSEPVYLADADLVAFQAAAASLWLQLARYRPTQLRATATY
ncbi:MAG: M23 family metallopeptidase, partial [Rhodospirillaceae bacterium]|nr:M23 family metallopeptidase [Rhodospirillaceae bacterium]